MIWAASVAIPAFLAAHLRAAPQAAPQTEAPGTGGTGKANTTEALERRIQELRDEVDRLQRVTTLVVSVSTIFALVLGVNAFVSLRQIRPPMQGAPMPTQEVVSPQSSVVSEPPAAPPVADAPGPGP
jgi:hypothetical protein